MGRTRVVWKWEDEGEGDDPVAPVWVDTFGDDDSEPIKSEGWDRWVPLSEAKEFARARGYEFLED